MDFQKLAEEIIQKAVEKGEFSNLPGSGRKIDLTAYFNTPAEFRVAHSLLSSNKFVPHEVELMKDIADLRVLIESATPERAESLKKELGEKELALRLLLERNNRRSDCR